MIAILGSMLFPLPLLLMTKVFEKQKTARRLMAAEAFKVFVQTEWDKREAEQAPAKAALLAERNKREAEDAAESARKTVAQQKRTKNIKIRRDALESALTRLNDVTDKVFSQSPEPGSVLTNSGKKFRESVEKALRDALADVGNSLSACQGFLSQDQIGNYQSGLDNLRSELAERFGFQDL